ncbi:RidA family protein [Aeromonas sobria]|uniref:Reactive intermediate/imine deaminase n=1 Tax=Aeromonas sobria TaxID=646 RepID=A0A1S2CPX3_AERSO|nr:RidA family protein [Aeromonas sobria]MBS4686294.1 RidA family protein [Aeromonas sobria]OHY90765.1 reactive intermediate/imine deaminase [Aeromonas sobria]
MRQVISTKAAPGAIGPYVQGVTLSNVTGNMIYTSGQIPLDPVSGDIPETIEAQTLRSLQNVQAIVEAAGAEVRNIIKTTVFVSDLNDFAAVNQVYNDFFTEHDAMYPARSCVEVARLPKDVKIEIEAIAAL